MAMNHEYAIFWDEPDEHQLRREREACEFATERQRKRDGHETYRIQHMETRPFCSECGRHFAWVQYHDKRYCTACAPADVEPIRPDDYVSHAVPRVYRKCSFCGVMFSYPENDPKIYCCVECEAGKREYYERRRKLMIDTRTEGQAEIDRQIVAAYVERQKNLREIAHQFGVSQYQVGRLLDYQGVVRRNRGEVARLTKARAKA